MASLLLCGAVSAQNWGTPDPYAQPSNTPIVASVGTLGGVAATITDNCRLGAFVGDELRGIATPQTDGKFWIQVFYTTNTDNITFKFFDGTTEYATCATTLTGSDAGYGTPGAPVMLNFTNGVEQTVALTAGWNWWSTTVETTLEDLETALNPNGLIIKTQTENVSYEDEEWMGDDITILPGHMYKIRVSANCSFILSGSPASNVSVIINYGSNWFGYPGSQPMSIANALGDFTPAEGDIIKSTNENTVFEDGEWMGDFDNLEPGKGYIYISRDQEVKTISFPNN